MSREQQRAYYLRHRKKILAYRRKWAKKNAARIKAQQRARYEANKEAYKAKAKAWKAANRKKAVASTRAWEKRNPEKLREIRRRCKQNQRQRAALVALAEAKGSIKPNQTALRIKALAEAKATQAAYGIQRIAYA